ncbi:MAG: heavy metal-binding domain-containing protein [Octadecabacter sp.]|nr:heavy metal-binding domain-containing protein [Octadecabacter sp.]
MAICTHCGKSGLGMLEVWQGGCPSCRLKSESADRDKSRGQAKPLNADIYSVLLTTETAPNLNITKRIEIVTAECAFGMNIFKDLFAGVRNIVGGRSEAVQKTMRDSRRTALYELKKEAYEVGANAVVGVDLDYVELAGTGSSMVMLVASGTAVVIED